MATNSLLPVFLLSLAFTELQLKILMHSHTDCEPTYWQSLTLFIILINLSLRSCIVSSCPYLCSYLYHLPLFVPSHSFLELILSSGPSGLYHSPVFAWLPHFLSPWQTSPSMSWKNQTYPLGVLLRVSCYCSTRPFWISKREENKAQEL